MKTSSAKAKGRKLQQWVVNKLLDIWEELEEDDLRSNPMSCAGEDIIQSPLARAKLGISIEAKNMEKVNVWKSMEQCKTNSGGHEPVLVIKKNHHKPLVVVDADYFFKVLHQRSMSDAYSD